MHKLLIILFFITSTLTDAALVLEDLGINLNNVTFIGHANDDRLFISQQSGEILIYENGVLNPTPFLSVSALVNGGFEQGLLSFAFHPDYQSNGFVFVFYSNLSNHATVARYQVSAADPNVVDESTATVIYSVNEGTGHYGGQVGFGHDGYLYFSIGDGGTQGDPECDAQDSSNVLGSILRIDVDQNVATFPFYGIPVDNPFDGTGGAPDAEVWSFGFRNPWRFSFDRLNGDFYFSDVGQNTREEFNFEASDAAGGNNYGWKAMEGNFCHDNNDPPSNCPLDTPICGSVALTPPAVDYSHTGGHCSITGGYVYRGDLASQLTGSYIYGDWCSGVMWASHQTEVVWETEELGISLSNVTTFGEDSGGEVYLSNGSAVFVILNDDLIFIDRFESVISGASESISTHF